MPGETSGASIGKAYVQIVPTTQGIKKDLTNALNGAVDGAGKSAGQSLGKSLAGGVKTALKVGAAGIGAAAAGVGALVKNAVSEYADFEQLTGGVKKLFGTGGKSLEEFAASSGLAVSDAIAEYSKLESAEKAVMENAQNAFRTSGLSMNDYMETVTGFSAALISGLEGDTQEAARIADMAVVDMADNANTFGTDMETLQTAYKNFAKGQFMMLDSLSLGYGGSAEEMARLVNESGIMNGAFTATAENVKDIPFDLLIQAIHKTQEEMGIAGTTSREASGTISGSVDSMKAAWSNLVVGLADDNADIGQLIDNLIWSIVGENGEGGVINNILPAVQRALEGITQLITVAVPQLLPLVSQLLTENLPLLIEAGTTLLTQGIIPGLIAAIPILIEQIPTIVSSIVTALVESWPQIKEAGINLLTALWEGFQEAFGNLKTWLDEKITGFKDIFNFEFTMPKLKLPHFAIGDGPTVLGVTLPAITVEWYKKAYEQPYMFTQPTVMGFGDGDGGEMVYGHNALMEDIRKASGGGERNQVININIDGAKYDDERSLAERISYELRALFDREEAAYG